MGPHEARGSHGGDGNQVNNCSRDTEGRIGEIDNSGLVQGVRSETEDEESEDICYP